MSLDRRIAAAWLWARREATIAGLAAAARHGARWIDDDIAIELIYPNTRPPVGVLTRRDVLLDGEATTVRELAVTTPVRTAFDIGRRGPHRVAVARLDALARATGLKCEGVHEYTLDASCQNVEMGRTRLARSTSVYRCAWVGAARASPRSDASTPRRRPCSVNGKPRM